MGSSVLDRLRESIDAISLVDTHEHLVSEPQRLSTPSDLFTLTADYVTGDLVSSGMPVRIMQGLSDTERSLDARWRDFAPYWNHVRTTGYGRAVLLAARDLFGVDDLSDATYRTLSERMCAANAPGWYEHVLRERADIEIAANQSIPEFDPTPIEEMDRRFFVPVVCLDDYVAPSSRADLEALEAKCGHSIRRLDDLERALHAAIDRARSAGAVALKVLLAYRRSLRFDSATSADAERVFNRLGRYPACWLPDLREPPPVGWDEARPLQDYLVHRLVRRSAEVGLPIQVHTGMQFGNGNELSNAHPGLLTNLFIAYPDARFDLFHAAYPFHGVAATLGKTFPNVYVDLCWTHVVSPWMARQILHEWIDTVPANKIFAFGGDASVVEGAYAQARIARENVARVLTEEVEAGDLDEDAARHLARRLLRENARVFFGMAPGSTE